MTTKAKPPQSSPEPAAADAANEKGATSTDQAGVGGAADESSSKEPETNSGAGDGGPSFVARAWNWLWTDLSGQP